ncbi:hypothetical protein O181_025154 [Austropuccinia psidii MF-1]|uniref:Uncharacterized protein n=1 Tax=Austropuccinia psidii MF-1 TaxID=1389203 RepID=A0A9Q3H0C8_9BASI|nr:hypothetical protein [Austropuccinia psidii MF-1]
MLERGHNNLKDTSVKLCGETGSKWKEYLPLITLEKKSQKKRTTGYSPLEIQFSQRAVLIIDIESKKYLETEWHKVLSTEEFLKARATQLSGKEEMSKKEENKLRNSREDSIKYWDRRLAHQIEKSIEP